MGVPTKPDMGSSSLYSLDNPKSILLQKKLSASKNSKREVRVALPAILTVPYLSITRLAGLISKCL